ncbi:jg2734 [Pararge aegeria aegeria]|uniref:Jg2734 protein n=1 Tax=Pararge aegeria aegeria TaxID=348720 RepID=A0A8S4RAF2_9NEOP|nr:jg2734 [Pararge aegeria aegeria]
MYRIFSLFALLMLVSGCHWEHKKRICPWMKTHKTNFNKNNHLESETDIESVQNNLMDTEIKLQEFCTKNKNVVSTEIYDDDTYTLKYELDETLNLNVTVKIFHRLMETTVKMANSNALVLEDLKNLPSMVKPENATWLLEDGLRIRIPYKVPLGTETSEVCVAINTEIIDVPVAVTIDISKFAD